jgi:chromate transporter
MRQLALIFLKLGTLGFGGPAVHIAMMEEEVVRKKKWMTEAHFLDLVGATNLIPGPNSTELAMHIGRERNGWKGLVIAGCCFIFPAVVITGFVAWLYQRYGQLPQVTPFVYGIRPAILSVLVALMIRLGKKALKSLELGLIGAAAALAVLLGFNEIIVLFAGGALGLFLYLLKRFNRQATGMFPFVLLQVEAMPLHPSQLKVFLVFLKIGSILYGSGYVLFGFLDAELVTRGWLSQQVLTDAIAAGQFTPGPVFSSATFIGWQLGEFGGAVAATVGIFLPSFFLVALLNPLVSRLRASPAMAAFLDAVNIVSIAIILSVVGEIAGTIALTWQTILIAMLGFTVTFFFPKLNTAFVIFGGALAGYLLYLMSEQA